MLNKGQLSEIREHLDKAQNPVFFYDNDADGLCSYVLLRKYTGRGKGVPIKNYPDLNQQYAQKAIELKADYVFILDKPVISREFLADLEMMHLPIVIIDHHEVQSDFGGFSNVHFYNPAIGKKKSNEPTTYLSYSVTNRTEDIWLAVIGCISDHYLPDFAKKFAKLYPEMWSKKIKKPFDAYYGSEIGKISQAINFGLKDSLTNVVKLQNHLIECNSPMDVLSEDKNNLEFREKYQETKKKLDALAARAEEHVGKKSLIFEYSGEISISSQLSNYLSYKYPKKSVVIIYNRGGIANISLRGKKIRNILEKILKEIPAGTGGGHEDAVGARVPASEVERFKELFTRYSKK